MIFLIDYFEDIKSRKSSSILMKIRKMLLFSKSFQYPYRFSVSSKINRVIELKKKCINFLFIAVIYFPLSI